MKLATTIGDVSQFVDTFEEAVRFYKDTGFKHLDFNFLNVSENQKKQFLSENWKECIINAKTAADELGFDFVQAHAPTCIMRGPEMKKSIEIMLRCIETCGILKIENLVIHSGCYAEFKYPEGKNENHKANEAFLRALIPTLEKFNVNILFENTTAKHIDGCYFPITGDDLNDFVSFMNHPNFGTVWDVGHAHLDNLNHKDEIIKMKNTLRGVHIHDNFATKDLHLAPFMGTVDFENVIEGLLNIDYSGYFTFETDGFFDFKILGYEEKRIPQFIELKKDSLKLLYKIGKALLSKHNIFDE